MSSPFTSYISTDKSVYATPAPASRGRGGTGAKRGRKPKVVALAQTSTLPEIAKSPLSQEIAGPSAPTTLTWQSTMVPAPPAPSGISSGVLNLPGASVMAPLPMVGTTASAHMGPVDEEGEDELPAMADDDYSAQLSWQSQSKDNLKVLMDNLTPEQYERFEAYRRHALPKQAVRKVIQQSLGQQVSQPVAQIVAGFSKVFVGEIIEKARAVQSRRGEKGPLSPEHLREAYAMYQKETGRVGAARPLKSTRLFVR